MKIKYLSITKGILRSVSNALIVLLLIFSLSACISTGNHPTSTKLQFGAHRHDIYLPMLRNKKVGLIVNQTSIVGSQHLLDFLIEKDVDVQYVFAPEHGFRGKVDAGTHIKDSKDLKTGVEIISIYGANKKPSPAILSDLDYLIFDIQDVGVRFYTYISSMHYMMEAAANSGITFVVLDRPNPNGRFVDGFVLEKEFKSFVGMHPLPVLHGMTVGELAKMIVGEGWLNSKKHLKLNVVAMQGYRRDMRYDLPVKPSPNLPNAQAIALYPSLCFFEPTVVSIGRGTQFPFQVVGHPSAIRGDFKFIPKPMQGASSPKYDGVQLFGEDLRQSKIEGLDLNILITWYNAINQAKESFFTSEQFFDKLAGTDKLRKALQSGLSHEQIKQLWAKDLAQFKLTRAPYLMYP